MDKKTRQYFEIAIVSCLKGKKEATSIEIFLYLRKRRFRVAFDLRQVAEICSTMKRREVLLSRSQRTLLFGSYRRRTFWRINPHFYLDHPNESMYTHPMSPDEYREGIKRRTKRKLKARK
jgi:hypothetical protein